MCNEPQLKKARTVPQDESKHDESKHDFETFMNEIEHQTTHFTGPCLDTDIDNALIQAEIDDALSKFDKFDEIIVKQEGDEIGDPVLGRSSSSSPESSPFDTLHNSASSITSNEEEPKKAKPLEHKINPTTVSTLKQAMADSSRLIGTFTALKTTYLKLCKEFNYLLGKFNDNERIKIELIHENNELKKLLVEVIKEKELDRKKYKAELAQRSS